MKKVVLLFIFSFLVTSCSQQIEQQDETISVEKDEIVIGERLSIYSDVMQEDRPYWVHLPDSYDSETYYPQKYPVLYLLDGDAHFHSVSGAMNFMSAGINGNMQIPELIIVAIPNTERTRDLTQVPLTVDFNGDPVDEPTGGGGDKFFEFIEMELIAKIEKDYRTLPHRTLVGHSLGGLISLYSFIENPALFNGYIAIDPSIWWESGEIIARAQEKLLTNKNLKARIFISMADHDPEGGMLTNIVAFNELLEGFETTDLQIDSFLYKGEDHGSVPLVSLYNGLLHVFNNYKSNMFNMSEDAEKWTTHYKNISDTLGVEFIPPEKTTDRMGSFSSESEENRETGLTFFKLNTENYPKSSHAFEKLAGLYQTMGENDLARENYQKAIELDGDNEDAIKALSELD